MRVERIARPKKIFREKEKRRGRKEENERKLSTKREKRKQVSDISHTSPIFFDKQSIVFIASTRERYSLIKLN